MSKKEIYTRDKEILLNDFYELLKVRNISPSFKFNNLRNDFLHEWTSTEGSRKINKKYWSKNAFELFKERYDNGITDQRALFKGIQLDHIVPRVWFEEMIMPIIFNGQKMADFEIPRYAVEFLFEKLVIGALVTADENQREIDGIQENVYRKRKNIHEVKWRRKPAVFKMPLHFYNASHEYYLNPWARYMDANIEVYEINWTNDTVVRSKLAYSQFTFKLNSLNENELKGYNYWSNKIEEIYNKNFNSQ